MKAIEKLYRVPVCLKGFYRERGLDGGKNYTELFETMLEKPRLRMETRYNPKLGITGVIPIST